ncbi:stage V sporulation protein AA [Lihuaxuella thermophila]|uniref:Stage V sporulation protein AA n=1 Tax=Lihuaxuella thermophila TaxID=1173111 RepID=A0A1H8EM37_9BACL|nr:stage V sporulation protein AA [Lihuaxuella thermophila]SEN20543.1 stage V sporulation protein AA [Lihuaxuella thermophila]
MKPILYLRLKKKVQAQPGQLLRIKDICRLAGGAVCEEIKEIPVYAASLNHGNYTVIDSLDILGLISEQAPSLDVRNVGPTQTIIEVHPPAKEPRIILVLLVWMILFVGSGLAIMNFHVDVSMQEVHQRIYYLVTGRHVHQPLILQIPYSIGIGTGMILFFNHLFKRRFNEEPSPMELEMFLYQETIDQYVINDEKQKVERDSHGTSV